MRLLWRVFATNAAVLVAATLVLVISPVTVSFPIALAELVAVLGGLAAMLVLNLVLLRRALRPLGRLTAVMRGIDPLRPGERATVDAADPEVAELTAAFNDMLGRVEVERRDSARRALAAQESERRRVARELHDEVGQALTAVVLELDRAGRGGAPHVNGIVAHAREAVRASLEDVRGIARRLRPEALDDLGLASALAALTNDVTRRTRVHVERVIAPGLPPLEPEEELVVYRVAQEALTNVVTTRRGAPGVARTRRPGWARRARSPRHGRRLRADGHAGRRRPARHARASGADRRQARRQERLGGGHVGAPATGGAAVTPARPARVLLADDHVMVRRGLRLVLDAEPDLDVVAEASDGIEALGLARQLDLDLAILDVSMPRRTGLQAAAEMIELRPELRVLMLSMHDNEQYLFEALKAGASGYVLKTAADRDLVEACRATLRGEPFLYPSAIAALVRDFLDRARDGDATPEDPLTPRELQVLKLVAEAHTNEQIADVLTISRKTVERHRENLMAKLGMRDRVELTRYAIRRGLVEP